MKHLTRLEEYPADMVTLARAIANLRYDALADFLQELHGCIARDAGADKARGRPHLHEALAVASARLWDAKKAMLKAWAVSKPYMPEGERGDD